MNFRLALYFFGTFFASVGAGVSDGLTAAGWIRLVILSLAAAAASAGAYYDKTHAAGSIDTAGNSVKTLAVLILAAVLTLSGCTAATRPKIVVGVTGSYQGATVGASYDGKTIKGTFDAGDLSNLLNLFREVGHDPARGC